MAQDADFYSFLPLLLRGPWLFFNLKDWWGLQNTLKAVEKEGRIHDGKAMEKEGLCPWGPASGKWAGTSVPSPAGVKTGSLAFWGTGGKVRIPKLWGNETKAQA